MALFCPVRPFSPWMRNYPSVSIEAKIEPFPPCFHGVPGSSRGLSKDLLPRLFENHIQEVEKGNSERFPDEPPLLVDLIHFRRRRAEYLHGLFVFVIQASRRPKLWSVFLIEPIKRAPGLTLCRRDFPRAVPPLFTLLILCSRRSRSPGFLHSRLERYLFRVALYAEEPLESAVILHERLP